MQLSSFQRVSVILLSFEQNVGWTKCFSDEILYGPRQANLVLIAYASSEGSGEPAHLRSPVRTSAAHSYKQ